MCFYVQKETNTVIKPYRTRKSGIAQFCLLKMFMKSEQLIELKVLIMF